MGKKIFLQIFLCLVLCLITFSPEKAQAAETQKNSLSDIQSQIRRSKVGKYGMTPIYPGDVKDGTYEIEVDSSSSFFKIIHADLIVDGDDMTAKITIGSLSYAYVFPGTAADAKNADKTDWIPYEEENETSIFTFPLKALNQGTDCAAYSKKKRRWYDRTIVFDASTLPSDALEIDVPDYELIEKAILAYGEDGTAGADPTAAAGESIDTQDTPNPVSIGLSDGEYSIEVNMTGGSGRASVSSPTHLLVRDGKAYARLLWSSVYYDYMIVDGTTYYNMASDGGNSTFEIPITVLDGPMTVIADTTAMGDPVEIEYALTFYEESIGTKGQIPQVAAKKVLVIALIIIAAGGVLNYFVKKKRK